MKGISHFLAGVAAATFVPGVVASAAQGSYLLVLGGFFGLLPDTLDFKFARYFEHHVNIDPDPANLDPQFIARAVAAEIDRAAETGKAIRVQLHNIPLGPNRWRQYRIRFDSERSEIVVGIGPIVNSTLVPLDESGQRVARVKTNAKIDYTYDSDMTADIFNGPSFAFVPRPHAVEVQFLPWHRAWSHSFTLAALLGLITGVLLGSVQAGLVAFLGMSAHIVEDQLGYLGSNLLWPFTKERSAGARLLHSGDAIPNFLAVWTALVLILFNLDRFSASIQNREPLLTPPLLYFGTTLILPALILIGVYAWERHKVPVQRQVAQQADIVAELKETEV
ncbi:MAG TPA: metal-dependent hydrolase [Anaerolineae bacterium]|nr:metal-dependent hydrolase [Anaerolineae bacterium]